VRGSHIGLEGGREGVRLAQQAMITERGRRLLSTFPSAEALA
jgi:hypothetical protein